MFIARSELKNNNIKPHVYVTGSIEDVTIEIGSAIAVAMAMLGYDETAIPAMTKSIKDVLEETMPQLNENTLMPTNEIIGDYSGFTEKDYKQFKKNIKKTKGVTSYCPHPIMVHYGAYTFDIIVEHNSDKIDLYARIYNNYGFEMGQFLGTTKVFENWTPDVSYEKLCRYIDGTAVYHISRLFPKESDSQ